MKCLRYVSILSFYFSGVLFMWKNERKQAIEFACEHKKHCFKNTWPVAGSVFFWLFVFWLLRLFWHFAIFKNIYRPKDFVTCQHDEPGVQSVRRWNANNLTGLDWQIIQADLLTNATHQSNCSGLSATILLVYNLEVNQSRVSST